MSKLFKRGPAQAEMNMTPLIDVTFQLIIFFMLVNNIIAEESVEMIVPDLQQARTRALDEGARITLNVVPSEALTTKQRMSQPGGYMKYPGEASGVRIQIQDFAIEDSESIRAELLDARQKNPTVEVLLRADAALFYRDVQPVMDAISSAEIQTVNVVARMPDKPIPSGEEP